MLSHFILKNRVAEITVMLPLIFILLLSTITNPDNLVSITPAIVALIKLIYFPLCFLYFKSVFLTLSYTDTDMAKAFSFLFYGLFIAIAASVFGFGAAQYGVNSEGVSIGYSGYFYAGNELAPLAVILYCFNLSHKLYIRASFKQTFVVFSVGFFTCLLIMTKVAVGGFFLVTILLPLFMNFNQVILKWQIYTFKYYRNLIVAGSAIISGIVIIFLDVVMAYYDKMSVFFYKADNIVSFLSSGRTERVGKAYDLFLNDYSLLQILFGGGEYYKTALSGDRETFSIELDPLDLILSNGFFGLLLIYGIWLSIAIYLVAKTFKSKDRHSGGALLIILFCISASFTSGHIISSALVSYYLAVIIAYAISRNSAIVLKDTYE